MSSAKRKALNESYRPVQYKPKSKQGSSTPGKIKNENCRASGQDKIFSKRNRSYKYRGYNGWVKKMKKLRDQYGGS